MYRSVVWVFAVCAAASAWGAAKGTITTENGDTQKGMIAWSSRDKAYVVTKGGVELQFKESEVENVDIEKPAALDDAIARVAQGQGAAAIPALQKIVAEYKHLQWDKVAGRYLAEAYLAASKPNDAYRACKAIIDGEPAAAYKGDLAPAYWASLLGLDRVPALEKLLDRAAKSGDGFSAGAALLMRGDIVMKAGNDSADAAKKALADGYLRVVLCCRDPEIADRLRPEALYKAAKCFEHLGQSGRADAMRRELKRTYKSSPWAAR
ncbi:MAG: hypothetical protein ACI4Q3_08830 [Kiritimatiellia bacterium]